VSNASANFVVEFANGDEVRIVHVASGRFGLACAVNLALRAYADAAGKPAPAIASARYECDGEILENYDREALERVA
jgi:hypothetical protein